MIFNGEEWEPEEGDREKGPWRSGRYTGRQAFRGVTYVLRSGFGVPEGYAVLGLVGAGMFRGPVPATPRSG